MDVCVRNLVTSTTRIQPQIDRLMTLFHLTYQFIEKRNKTLGLGYIGSGWVGFVEAKWRSSISGRCDSLTWLYRYPPGMMVKVGASEQRFWQPVC